MATFCATFARAATARTMTSQQVFRKLVRECEAANVWDGGGGEGANDRIMQRFDQACFTLAWYVVKNQDRVAVASPLSKRRAKKTPR